MAILFDDAATEYLTVTATPFTNEPITMFCWFYSDSTTIDQCLMSLGNNGTNGDWSIFINGATGGDPVRARKNNDAGSGVVAADTTSGYSANTWHTACGVFGSDTSRDAFIDGGSKGSNTSSRTDPTPNFVAIGALQRSAVTSPMSGRIAEAAIWNVALSDADIATLALGFSPLFIKPESLMFYLPMLALGGAGLQNDWVGGLSLTETNTPATAEHPPQIIYPQWVY